MGKLKARISESLEEVAKPRQEDIEELSAIITHRLHYFQYLALRRLGNVHDAEDAVQNAFLSAFRNLGKFRGEAQMSTWLTSIVINSTRMKAREHLRQRLHIPIDGSGEGSKYHVPSESLSDYGPDPESILGEKEFHSRVERMSARLSPGLREAFKLRILEGFSIREAARALGIGEAAVKTRSSRARANLKRMLQNSYDTQPRR